MVDQLVDQFKGKQIYTLLNHDQVAKLKEFNAWQLVLDHTIKLLPPSEANLFKAKFNLGFRIHITKEHEYVLHAKALEKCSDLDLKYLKYFMTLDRAKKIKRGLAEIWDNVNFVFNKDENITLTPTPTSTWVLTLSDEEKYNQLQTVFKKSNTELFISRDMAAGLYKQIGDNAVDDVSAQASSRSLTHYQAAASTLVSDISDTARFSKALKALFPDLELKFVNTMDMKNSTRVMSPDANVIEVSFNPYFLGNGYKITSSNPDNLYRIRECCELSMTHILSGLEAAKILQTAVDLNKRPNSEPISLTLLTLEKALEQLEISYISIKEVGLTYEIICSSSDWKKLIERRQATLTLDPNKVTLTRAAIDSQTVKEFFNAISSADIDKAKRLLGSYPGLLNEKHPEFASSPLIHALFQADQLTKQNAPSPATSQSLMKPGSNELNNLLDFCSYLLEQPGIDIAHVDSTNNTALHHSIYYYSSTPDTTVKEKFLHISLVIWEKARIEGSQYSCVRIKNNNGKSAFPNLPNIKEIKEIFAENDVWNLLEEGKYYDFIPAIQYYKDNGQLFQSKDSCWLKLHPKTRKYPLQMAVEKLNVAAVESLVKLSFQGYKMLELQFTVKINGNQPVFMDPFEFVLWMEKNPTYSNPQMQSNLKNIREEFIRYANINTKMQWIEKLRFNEQQSSEKLQQAETKIKELEQQLNDFDKKTGKLSEQQLTRTTAEIQQLQEKLQQQNQLVTRLKTEWMNTEETRKTLEADVKTLKEQVERVQTEKLEMETTLSKLTEENKELQAKITTQSEMKTNAQENLENLNEETSKISEKNHQLSTQLDELKTTNQQLSGQVSAEESIANTLKEQIHIAEEKKPDNTQKLSLLTTENENLQKQINAQKELQDKLTQEATSLETERSKLVNTYDYLNQEVEKLQSQVVVVSQSPIIEQRVEQAVEQALSQAFFRRLQQNAAYKKLVSRIDEIQQRPTNNPFFQDSEKNKSKAAALSWIKDAVEGKDVTFTGDPQPLRRKATFEDIYTYLKSPGLASSITQSTRKQEGIFSFFTGEVTSEKLFYLVEQVFEREHEDRKERSNQTPANKQDNYPKISVR